MILCEMFVALSGLQIQLKKKKKETKKKKNKTIRSKKFSPTVHRGNLDPEELHWPILAVKRLKHAAVMRYVI